MMAKGMMCKRENETAPMTELAQSPINATLATLDDAMNSKRHRFSTGKYSCLFIKVFYALF